MRVHQNVLRQAGVGIIEFSIVALLSMMVTAALLYGQAQSAKDKMAALDGEHLVQLNAAVGKFMSDNAAALINGSSVTGVANAYAPSLQELRSLGFLDSNYGDNDLYGNPYMVSIALTPAGCTPANCSPTSVVWANGPIIDSVSGSPDTKRAALAAQTAGANAGVSTRANPAMILGPKASWSVANPTGSVLGVLAMRNGGAGASSGLEYLRADGTRVQTGTQQGNFAVQSNLTAGGALSAAQGSITNDMTVGGTLGAGAANVSNNLGVGGGITANGAVTAGSVSAVGNVTGNMLRASSGVQTTGGDVVASGGHVRASQGLWGDFVNTLHDIVAGGAGFFTGSLSSASLSTTGDVTTGGKIAATGNVGGKRLVANEYLQVQGTAVSGTACAENGLIARDASTGKLLACSAYQWGSTAPVSGGLVTFTTVTGALSGITKTASFSGQCPATSGTCTQAITVNFNSGVINYTYTLSNCGQLITTISGAQIPPTLNCSMTKSGSITVGGSGPSWVASGSLNAGPNTASWGYGGGCGFDNLKGFSCVSIVNGSETMNGSMGGVTASYSNSCSFGLALSLDYLIGTAGATPTVSNSCLATMKMQ